MKLYMKQRIFSWGDHFTVYDSDGNDCYVVKGEVFSWGKKLHLYDASGVEVLFISQKLFSFLPRYRIFRGEAEIAQVIKEFRLFRNEYTVEGLGWKVDGNFLDHNYEVSGGGQTIASVSKKWFTLGDAYEIDILDGIDEAAALAVVLVIDACIEAENNS